METLSPILTDHPAAERVAQKQLLEKITVFSFVLSAILSNAPARSAAISPRANAVIRTAFPALRRILQHRPLFL